MFCLVANVGYVAAFPQTSTVRVTVQPGEDIGSKVNAAIASLAGKPGTIELPTGSYVQLKPISVSGTGIHIVGSGTVLNYNSANYHLVDSADSPEGWRGSGVNVTRQASIGEDHPDPMEGEGYIQVATGPGSAREVRKAIPSTNFNAMPKIGVWATFNLTRAQHNIEFFVSDGSRTAFWTLALNSIYAEWKFFGLERGSPSGTEGGMPDMARITSIGFRQLGANTKYYFDAIALFAPTAPSLIFSSCAQCSLSNVTIRWAPAGTADVAITANQNTHDLLLENVHTIGASDGISFAGSGGSDTCRNCTAEFASRGISILNGSQNQLLSDTAARNVVGIYLAAGATHNTISAARCIRNNDVDLWIDGNDNQIKDSDVDTWMTFGFLIRGGAHNNITGLTARSAVGESAVQLIAGAADNTFSNINIEQSGGSGLDMGGGTKPPVRNVATDVTIHHSGSSSWHGGPGGSSEGRGIVLSDAQDNRISHAKIYDTGETSTAAGVEGIIINAGASGNTVEDILIYHSRHEGITVWDASDNTIRNVRLLGNGLREGNKAGIRIDHAAKNTVVENVCYWMNGGGGIQNLSNSSSIRAARQVKGLNPDQKCE